MAVFVVYVTLTIFYDIGINNLLNLRCDYINIVDKYTNIYLPENTARHFGSAMITISSRHDCRRSEVLDWLHDTGSIPAWNKYSSGTITI